MDRPGRVEVDRAGDPAVPPLVLVLHVGRIRPLHDPQVQGVRAGSETVGQVELRRQVRILADPDRLAVERDDEDALGGADVEDDPPSRPVGGELELALVDAGRVQLRDRRRAARERHLDVRVVRDVPGPGHRPDTRDVSLRPVGAGGIVGSPQELEPPPAVEREPLAVLDAVHGEAADPRQFGVVPRLGHPSIVAGAMGGRPATDPDVPGVLDDMEHAPGARVNLAHPRRPTTAMMPR